MSSDEPLSSPEPASATGGSPASALVPKAPADKPPAALLAAIFVLALLLRLTFLSGVLSAHDAAGLGHLNGDSTEYLHLALNLAGGEGYTTDHIRSRLAALARPPVYPLLLAGPIALLGPEISAGHAWHIPPDIAWRIAPNQGYDSELSLAEPMRRPLVAIFLLQAVGDALLATLAAWLAWHLTRRPWAAAVVGAALALNITGIGLSATVLADGLFALICFGALIATLFAAQRVRAGGDRRQWLAPALAAAALWAMAQGMKPALTFWPAGLAVGWLLLLGRSGLSRRGLAAGAVVIGGLLLAIGGWTLRNQVVEGLATPSSITERNLRYMIQPDVAVWADFGRKPRPSERSRYYWRYAKRDLGLESAPGMTPGDWVRGQRYRAMEVLRLYPSLVVKVYFRNIESVLTEPWDLYREQLPRPRSPYAPQASPTGWTRIVRTGFFPLQWLDEQKVLHWLATSLVMAAPLVLLVRRRRPTAADESSAEGACPLVRRAVIFLWIFCLYLVLLSGTTRDQGSRILYPAHAPGLVLLMVALARVGRSR